MLLQPSPSLQLQLIPIRCPQGTCDLAPMSWWRPATQPTFLTLFPRRSFHLRFSGMLPEGVTLILAR